MGIWNFVTHWDSANSFILPGVLAAGSAATLAAAAAIRSGALWRSVSKGNSPLIAVVISPQARAGIDTGEVEKLPREVSPHHNLAVACGSRSSSPLARSSAAR